MKNFLKKSKNLIAIFPFLVLTITAYTCGDHPPPPLQLTCPSHIDQKHVLRYRDVVTLAFKNGPITVGKDDLVYIKSGPTSEVRWKEFVIINPGDITSSEIVHFGEEFALMAFNNKYVVRENSAGNINGQSFEGIVSADRTAIGPWEKFKFYDFFNSSNKLGECITITGSPELSTVVSIQSVYSGKFITPISFGRVVGNSGTQNGVPYGTNSIAIQIVKKPWTDFYYDKPTGDPQCPKRGRWDGANCFVANVHDGGNPFIYNNNFYQNSASQNPYMGWFDGAHVQVGYNPPGSQPFIRNGSMYLKPF